MNYRNTDKFNPLFEYISPLGEETEMNYDTAEEIMISPNRYKQGPLPEPSYDHLKNLYCNNIEGFGMCNMTFDLIFRVFILIIFAVFVVYLLKN